MTHIVCQVCQSQIDISDEMADGSSIVCSQCGTKIYFKKLTGDIQIKGDLWYKGKRFGKGGWFRRGKIGASWSHFFKRWMHRERHLDKERDRYTEVITDPSNGQIIHEVDEHLTQHQGHGDAKKRDKK